MLDSGKSVPPLQLVLKLQTGIYSILKTSRSGLHTPSAHHASETRQFLHLRWCFTWAGRGRGFAAPGRSWALGGAPAGWGSYFGVRSGLHHSTFWGKEQQHVIVGPRHKPFKMHSRTGDSHVWPPSVISTSRQPSVYLEQKNQENNEKRAQWAS